LKSSSGKYYVALDHVRAVAIFIVFSWHFINFSYGGTGYNTPVPIFPLSILMEGQTGVAIFMTLSGYLFAKLLDGKRIDYKSFIWNRCIRLLPLLILVMVLAGIEKCAEGMDIMTYLRMMSDGLVYPSLPKGGWSITVEFHFYLLLPLILWLARKSKYALPLMLATAMLLRIFLYYRLGEIQSLSYFTIIGRIDQFLLGIAACQYRAKFVKKHFLVVLIALLFGIFYYEFDLQGGFYNNPSYPSKNPLWIVMPTVEGMSYAAIIAWYDNSFKHSTGRFSRFIAAIGTYSYSIYLLHPFVVFKLVPMINSYVDLPNRVYMGILSSSMAFLVMIPIGYISYRLIELPFFKFRVQYIRDGQTANDADRRDDAISRKNRKA
jgi:peptidoglycan/LPS O-acetylase OafA/YrhL